jgi:hypothetical protein
LVAGGRVGDYIATTLHWVRLEDGLVDWPVASKDGGRQGPELGREGYGGLRWPDVGAASGQSGQAGRPSGHKEGMAMDRRTAIEIKKLVRGNRWTWLGRLLWVVWEEATTILEPTSNGRSTTKKSSEMSNLWRNPTQM